MFARPSDSVRCARGYLHFLKEPDKGAWASAEAYGLARKLQTNL